MHKGIRDDGEKAKRVTYYSGFNSYEYNIGSRNGIIVGDASATAKHSDEEEDEEELSHSYAMHDEGDESAE